MKIVISGASGSVGSELVPLLTQAGHSLLLISRDAEKLKTQFTASNVASLEAWESFADGYDAFLHLAVLNNDQAGSLEDYFEVNSDLTGSFAAGARRLGIPHFIYPSTVQALLPGKHSPYVQSKRAGEKSAQANFGCGAETMYLGLVHGRQYSGKLALLNGLPRSTASFFFSLFSALKPTTSINQVADYFGPDGPSGPHQSRILTDRKIANSSYRAWRKFVDGVFVVAVVLLLPLLVLVWLMVVLEDGRPGLFSQERIGRGGSVFQCFKVRTMRNGTEPKGTHLVAQPAITGVGRILRRFKIDELPQAWNVLRGDMSLIGPRPCLPNQHEVIAARDSLFILEVQVGLTGWAQVNGVDMRDPVKIALYDAEYLGLQSVWFDLLILRRTLFPARGRTAQSPYRHLSGHESSGHQGREF